jgi:hypothetical protein
MSRPSQPETHPTHIIVDTGEFLQAVLQPSLVAALWHTPLPSHDPSSPAEIAEDLWYSAATAADELNALANLPMSLVRTVGRDNAYIKTDIGLNIGGEIDQMATKLGVFPLTMDFTTETVTSRIATILTPLSHPESSLTWIVLNALRELSDTHNRLDLLGTPQPVAYEPLAAEIEQRLEHSDDSLDLAHLQQTLTHLENTDILLFDGDECTLTEKGHEWIVRFHNVATIIETRRQILTALLAWRGTELITDDLCEMLAVPFRDCSPHLTDFAARGVIDRIEPPDDATKYPADRVRYRLNMDHPTIAALDQRIGDIAAEQ